MLGCSGYQHMWVVELIGILCYFDANVMDETNECVFVRLEVDDEYRNIFFLQYQCWDAMVRSLRMEVGSRINWNTVFFPCQRQGCNRNIFFLTNGSGMSNISILWIFFNAMECCGSNDQIFSLQWKWEVEYWNYCVFLNAEVGCMNICAQKQTVISTFWSFVM